MNLPSRLLRIVRYVLFLCGVCMLLIVAAAYIHRFASLRAEQARFIERQEQMRADRVEEETDAETGAVAQSALAGSTGVSTIASGAAESPLEPLGLLKISKLRLEVPILKGTDELTLNRGLGWIDGTSLPGREGNSGIAGHRDSFFRHLEDIQVGDAIEVLTPTANHIYTVDGMRVVSPSEIDVLRPRQKSSITLVTCYPFSFIGPAPSRYIVEASLKQ